jgi:hypothetical protein
MLLGEEYKIAVNRNIKESIMHDDANRKSPVYNILTAIESSRQGGTQISYEQTVAVGSGSKMKMKYFVVDVSPLIIYGKITGFSVLFKDITQLHESMQKLHDSQERMMEQERMAFLGQMIGGIAHNLKTPIMSISGCIAAAEKGRIGESYILGNDEITLKKLSKILNKELGCQPIKFFLPIRIAESIAKKMEKQAAKNGAKPIMTTFSVYNLKRNNKFDYSKAANELGYTTRPVEETLRDEARWLKENGKI